MCCAVNTSRHRGCGRAMNNNKKGFTLIELVIVTVIMGILASMGLPYYLKTVEVSKASDALSIGHLLGNSYRMYLVDNPSLPLTGSITNACNTGACDTSATDACRLVRCNYVARQDWDSSSYSYSIGAAADIAATVSRKTGASPGTNNTPYNGWGYTFSTTGGCAVVGEAPSCPGF